MKEELESIIEQIEQLILSDETNRLEGSYLTRALRILKRLQKIAETKEVKNESPWIYARHKTE